jgi:hypothetical protein
MRKINEKISELKFIKSSRGGRICLCDGYIYRFVRYSLIFDVWRCAEESCRVFFYTTVENLCWLHKYHNHNEDFTKCKLAEVKSIINVSAVVTELPPRVLIANATHALTNSEHYLMPHMRSVARNIQNIRKRNILPSSNQEEEIPENFKKTIRGELLVQYSSPINLPNRIIIFSTTSNMEILSSSNCWIGDGTFKMAPSNFVQVYVLFGRVVNEYIPLVYVLLENKTKNIYNIMFKKLKELIKKDNLKTLILDFEEATAIAAKEVFPTVSINYCLFHFGQIFYRNIQLFGLSSRYIMI